MPDSKTIQIIESSSRAEWLGNRRQDVTASQIGGVLDVHPYCTPYSIWAEKTGRVVDDLDLDSAVLRRGRLLEGLGAELATAELPAGSEVVRNTANTYWRDTRARIGATPDMIAKTDRGKGVIQLKNIEPSIYAKNWPDGECPLWIALQALTEAKLVGADWAMVGALRVGFSVDFDLIEIPLHEAAWARLQSAVADFWANVEAGVPPSVNYQRDGAAISMMSGASNGSTVDLSGDNELVAALADRERLKSLHKLMGDQIGTCDAMIRHKAGEAEVVLAGDFRVSLRTESVKGFTVAPRTQRPIRIKRIRGTASNEQQ